MKLITIIGARPQFVKAAVVSRAFREHRPDVREIIVHTGQHYDPNMSDVFFEELDIPKPHHHLGIGGGSHGQNTGRMIEAIERVIIDEQPDWVLVYGDTDSTLAGTLAAVKLHVPVAHVEAGLRSFNRKMPEEINRVLADHAASLLFTPTTTATRNLQREGIEGGAVQQVGDVMFDAALYYRAKAFRPASVDVDGGFVLATIHRAENTDDPDRLRSIIRALHTIASSSPVVLPLHPRTRSRLAAAGLDTGNITICEPVGYLEMIWLLENCRLVVTDSGGLQKEAYFFYKPCVVTRDETEWVELVDGGTNILLGADYQRIVHAAGESTHTASDNLIFGRGDAGQLIATSLVVGR